MEANGPKIAGIKRTEMTNEADGEAPSVVAPLAEHRTCNSKVVGSDPTDGKGVSYQF